jgi:hypothetical protein
MDEAMTIRPASSENHLALKAIPLLSNACSHGVSADRDGIHVQRQR